MFCLLKVWLLKSLPTVSLKPRYFLSTVISVLGDLSCNQILPNKTYFRTANAIFTGDDSAVLLVNVERLFYGYCNQFSEIFFWIVHHFLLNAIL